MVKTVSIDKIKLPLSELELTNLIEQYKKDIFLEIIKIE